MFKLIMYLHTYYVEPDSCFWLNNFQPWLNFNRDNYVSKWSNQSMSNACIIIQVWPYVGLPHEIQITTVLTGLIFLQIPHLLYKKYTVLEKK